MNRDAKVRQYVRAFGIPTKWDSMSMSAVLDISYPSALIVCYKFI